MPAESKRFRPAKAGIATVAALATSMAAFPLTTTSASAGERHYRGEYSGYKVVPCGPRNDYCGERRGKRKVVRHHHRDRSDGDVIGAIALGVIGTAIVAGALSNTHNAPPRYRDHSYNQPRYSGHNYNQPNYDYPPAPAPSNVVTTYGSTFEPWSREWYNWCDNRYRSFNPNTGTYRGYDGRDHFCVVR